MRYDKKVLLLKRIEDNNPDGLDHSVSYSSKEVLANVKRTNLSLNNGKIYDATIIRVYGEYEADAIGFIGEYDANDESTIHTIQKVGRHFNHMDFYIIHGEVILHG